MKKARSVFILVFVFFLFAESFAQKESNQPARLEVSKLSYWAYDALDLPDLSAVSSSPARSKSSMSKSPGSDEPILIAVVDDAFRLSHKDLKEFIYTNPLERADNGIDDDGNGKSDDIRGWDLSDNDNNVYPPGGREEEYYHGTFISSSIISILKRTYGEDASKMFKILPVKVLSDYEELPFLRDGYKGIAYAIEEGADIICCAWSGGEATEEEKKIIEQARKAGIPLIGSAGNTYSEKVDNPAAMEGVLALAGIDRELKKTQESNYGEGVDLAAPAREIRAAHPLADNAYFYAGGTSGAAALVTGCVAVLKAADREASPELLYEALMNTATPLDYQNPSFSGKLGAGLPQLEQAVHYLASPGERGSYFRSERPKGTIYLDAKGSISSYGAIYSDEGIASYEIGPKGAFKGFRFTLPIEGEGRKGKFSPKQMLSFYNEDSLFYQSSLDEAPAEVFIPGTSVRLDYADRRRFAKSSPALSYAAVPIDSSSLYCSGTSYYSLPSAEISDGSGKSDYANSSSCKWQITVDEGKRIRFNFSEFDTEAKVDFVYLFDGESTIPGNMIAKFSGPNIPPEVSSRSNSVLLWFVTDDRGSGGGWKLTYTAE